MIRRSFVRASFRLAVAALVAATIVGSVSRAADEKVPPLKGPIRVKAGLDKEWKDHEGNAWQADSGYDGGETIARAADLKIENTEDPDLYRSERYSMDSYSWDVPNGKYKVKLHFAETYEEVTEAGQRVFSFDVAGKEFKDFDVFVKAGGANKAYIESVDVEVTDGKLKITFTPKVQNPLVNGIEIIPADEAAK